MYCSNCGNKIDDDARFCPFCGAQSAPTGAARIFQEESTGQTRGPQPVYSGQPHPQHQQPRQPRPVQQGGDPFTSMLNGTKPMAPMPLISLIMFMIYATFMFVNQFARGAIVIHFFGFVPWFTFILALGAAAMFIVSHFNKSRKRLFFLIGCAALALLYTVSIFRAFWAYIVFGLLLLGCIGVIVVYYLFEGRILNYRIKMFGCIGLMLFSFLQLVCTLNFGLTLLFMVPYVALALGFMFYSPYVNR